MKLVCVLLIVAGILTEIENQTVIAIGKFLIGVAAGAITCYVPKFIDEMSPSAVKGTTGTYFGLSICFGIFIGPLIALPIPLKPDCVVPVCPELEAWKKDWYVTQYWHILFSLPIITAVV
jgi:MFS family permease